MHIDSLLVIVDGTYRGLPFGKYTGPVVNLFTM